MILEENNLQTVHLRVNLILHRVDSLICTHPKNSNHLRSHLRAIMALDHSRLGPRKQIGPNFLAFDKFTLQNLANN